MVDYLIGIDGGGSGTRAAVQRVHGETVGTGTAGPSALGQGVEQAWDNIQAAVRQAFEGAQLPIPTWKRCALAAGLSGVSHAPWREAFLAADPGLARLEVETDSFTMLMGAHGGQPGVIVIAGTGSIAEALRADGSRATVGGWGFRVDDEGSGGWLGLQAVRHGLAAFDGRANASPLARRVWMHCGDERESLQAWCQRSGQFEFAQLARAVFECEATDPVAARLLQQATGALEDLALAIDARGRLPLAVAGSIGERLAPRMRPALRSRLVPAKAGAAEGALMLARRLLVHTEEAL
ncbi:MAG TPA: BadF/BadG/BcrA/BcrD ATPase family protein [Ramlibacter sp.]|uniref:BadF/BadG/BcrA/BcrD ATPase family protein n=1 Tax=Ramlibacter sp. TaxID=1917967 RepID=UPI002D7EB3C8|nr:BadF/BadG/BcrA/BcrD ATPase family protein [Ramlibacter sp.]HET8747539.1 BadF/BadG/BcrA/BcrD ATPase family protein [Ramlibacter sp.]